MSKDLHDEIHNNLDLKDTEELLEIWQTNDRVAWTDKFFDVLQEIVQTRLGVVPAQFEPVQEYAKKIKFLEGNEEALQKIDADQNPPVFYQPKQVLWLDTWLNLAAVAAVVVVNVKSLLQMGTIQHNLSYLFMPENRVWNIVAWVITIVFSISAIVVQIVIAYFPLKALGTVLKILMEMEFDSRDNKGKQAR